jgi:hypothetical protein
LRSFRTIKQTGGYAMKQVVIKNPVITSPFAEPARHFKFDEDGAVS